jgi:hypothetical protein
MSKKKVVILKNKPLPKTKLIDLSKLKDWKHEEIVRHANKGLAVCTKDVGVAGYALVVWNLDGTLGTSMWAARGPIGRGMIPALAHDALLKRIAAVEAVEDLEDTGRVSK